MKQQIKTIYKNNEKPHRPEEHCLAILGDTAEVNRFADFCREHSASIDIVGANLIVDYLLRSKDVDSKQAQAFKDGVFLFAQFFNMCKIERENREERIKDGEDPSFEK